MNPLKNDIKMIEDALYSYLNNDNEMIKLIFDAMSYSVDAGGKRIRPRLVLEFARLCGADVEAALPFACAVEYIHTYSLIHDDLPCMDNDDMRRGKPSNHTVYGEDIALLAGDALQSLAFEVMSSSDTVNKAGADKTVRCINTLAGFCGASGMVGGQVIDLENEKKTASYEEVLECNDLKTGGLIKASCVMGAILGGADENHIEMAETYGRCIGISFQIVDDILDITSTDEVLGKPVGSDIENNKSTYVSLFGIDKCRQMVDELTAEALKALDSFDFDKTALKELALSLAKRKK